MRTKVQGRQPPSQCRASTRAIFMAVDDATADRRGQASPCSRPAGGSRAELVEGGGGGARVPARERPGRLGVVTPVGQVERDVVEIRMCRHVLQRLEAVLD